MRARTSEQLTTLHGDAHLRVRRSFARAMEGNFNVVECIERMPLPWPLGLELHIAEHGPVRRTQAAQVRAHFLLVDLLCSP